MFFGGSLGGAGLNQVTSTFWNRTMSFLKGEQVAIPHLKEQIQGFHVTPNAQIFLVKLPCYGLIIRLYDNALVQY